MRMGFRGEGPAAKNMVWPDVQVYPRGPSRTDSQTSPKSFTRSLNIATGICLGLILYGSLLPLDFSFDVQAIAARWHRGMDFWEGATKADLVSNFLLYIPLGALLAARARSRGRTFWPAFLAASIVCLVLSVAIESTQLLSATRTSQIHDVATNALGGLTGAAMGAVWGLKVTARLLARKRGLASYPARWGALLLCLVLFADGWAPLTPVRNKTDFLANIEDSCWSVGQGLAEHPWHCWLICEAGVFAVLAILLYIGAARWNWTRAIPAALLATAVAAVLEGGKVFLDERTLNIASFALAGIGAVAGAVLAASLRSRISLRTLLTVAALVPFAYLVYREWAPFHFAWDWPAILAKAPHGLALLPMTDFALNERAMDDVVHLARIAALAAAASFAWQWRAKLTDAGAGGSQSLFAGICWSAIWWGLIGLALELGQFPLPGRQPSVTDTLMFAVGGAVGAWLAAKPALVKPARGLSQSPRA